MFGGVHFINWIAIYLLDKQSSNFKFIQNFMQVARANLGGPDLQLFKDKFNIITVITIKDRTNRI